MKPEKWFIVQHVLNFESPYENNVRYFCELVSAIHIPFRHPKFRESLCSPWGTENKKIVTRFVPKAFVYAAMRNCEHLTDKGAITGANWTRLKIIPNPFPSCKPSCISWWTYSVSDHGSEADSHCPAGQSGKLDLADRPGTGMSCFLFYSPFPLKAFQVYGLRKQVNSYILLQIKWKLEYSWLQTSYNIQWMHSKIRRCKYESMKHRSCSIDGKLQISDGVYMPESVVGWEWGNVKPPTQRGCKAVRK